MNRSHRLFLSAALAAVALSAVRPAAAQTVDFSGVNLTQVSSGVGQNFAFATGSVNVRLLSGAVSSLTTGSSPDPTGFYALQSGDLTPAIFRFTFDKVTSFAILENESLASYEVNEFLLPGGAWSNVTTSNATASGTSSDVVFRGNNGAPPYGDYSLEGTGLSFDFRIANDPAVPTYGSAISLNIGAVAVPEGNTFALALPALGMIGAAVIRRRKK